MFSFFLELGFSKQKKQKIHVFTFFWNSGFFFNQKSHVFIFLELGLNHNSLLVLAKL